MTPIRNHLALLTRKTLQIWHRKIRVRIKLNNLKIRVKLIKKLAITTIIIIYKPRDIISKLK